MSVLGRGVRNAFRNSIRTFSIVVILGLSIAMALSMLLARQAVDSRIDSVESSIGNVINISAAGLRGFQGGGEALGETDLERVAATPHVVGLTMTLLDRLTTEDTNLQSAVELGTLGRRFAGQGGQGAQQGAAELRPGLQGPGGQVPGGQGLAANFTPPLTVLGTTDPSSLDSAGGGQTTLTDGVAFASESDDDVALIGASLAAKNNLTLGSTFTAYGATMTVSGLFTSGNTFGDALAVIPLRTLQRLTGQPGAVTNAVVQVDSIKNVNVTQAALATSLGTAADVVSPLETSEQALEPLSNIRSISSFSLTGAVAAGAVIIFLTMLMIVRERRREIAVLKAIGAPNRKVTTQFIYEAVTFTMLAAVLGVAGGVVAANPITRLLVSSNTPTASAAPAGFPQGPGGGARALRQAGGQIAQVANAAGPVNLDAIRASVGIDLLLYGLAAALVITVVGSAIPAYLIGRIRPAEVLRGE